MLNKIKERFENASKELFEERIDICLKCPQVRNSKNIGLTCGVFMLPNYVEGGKTCGCKLEWKANLKGQECPQKKW